MRSEEEIRKKYEGYAKEIEHQHETGCFMRGATGIKYLLLKWVLNDEE